jgi:fermentation-respiration switch protein FrsA (DUF1100 family)
LHQSSIATVELTARDGTALVGHWYENPNAKRVVVAMHGWRSCWDQDFGFIAPFLHRAGCSVLYAEQRGQNASGGEHMTFGLLERQDCLDWANWVAAHTVPNLPVYLVGISMGATTVLMAAGTELPKNVIGVLADCGYTTGRDIIELVIGTMKLPPKLSYPFVRLAARVYGHFDLEAADALRAMKNCKVPVIFYHGESDDFVPCYMSRQNYEACTCRKRLVTVPGAGHGLCYLVDPEGYLQAAREFFHGATVMK